MSEINQILSYKIYENSVENILISIGIILAVYLLALVFKAHVSEKLNDLSSKTKSKFDDILVKAIVNAINRLSLIFGFYAAKQYLTISTEIDPWIDKALLILSCIIITHIVQVMIVELFDNYFRGKASAFKNSILPLIKNLSKIFIWLGSLTFILANLGYSISSLTAGLGISGLAIALAVKPTLEAFFSSLAIFSDKPFKLGDVIKFNSEAGTVKNIGLRTTVLKTFTNTELVIPNTDLTSGKIENLSKRESEKITGKIGVEYSTSSKKLEKAIQIVKDIFASQEFVGENFRAYFEEFGDSALIISFTYFISTEKEYNERVAIVSEINFEIKKQFEKNKIEFAFPTQTVILSK